ncbi:hypothetical protein BMETH_1905_0 [methanotrophic bacterial endosymbiont of Bathymodiolus sp.]|nr:hypothetical protein BMETH_1905_0 [methanotrophic bacterial endosymbiont of Bathymodiolus sp.]
MPTVKDGKLESFDFWRINCACLLNGVTTPIDFWKTIASST